MYVRAVPTSSYNAQTSSISTSILHTSIAFEQSLRSPAKQPPPAPALPDVPEYCRFFLEELEGGVEGGDIA